MIIYKGTTPTIVFLMVDATDDETAEEGLSPSVEISKNGGAFAAITNSVSEISDGWYKVALTSTETNTNGPLIVRATGTGADEWREVHQVIDDPADGVLDEALSGHTTAGSLGKAIADILADTGTDGVALASATLQAIADAAISRGVANVEDTADADSLAALILTALHSAVSGTTLTIKKTDDSTTFDTKTITTSGSAEPITGVADP